MTNIMCMVKDVALDMLFRKPLAHTYRCPCSRAPWQKIVFEPMLWLALVSGFPTLE